MHGLIFSCLKAPRESANVPLGFFASFLSRHCTQYRQMFCSASRPSFKITFSRNMFRHVFLPFENAPWGAITHWLPFFLKRDHSWPIFCLAALLSSLKKLITDVVCLRGCSVLSQSKHKAPSCLLGFLCSQNIVRLTDGLAFSCLNCYNSWSMFCPATFSFFKSSIKPHLMSVRLFCLLSKSLQQNRMSAWPVLLL